MRLTEATRTQLSPIFGFFDDAHGAGEKLWAAVDGDPAVCGELDGVSERLWPVTDPDVLAEVCAAMIDRKIYIADGHHRYTTALEYARRSADCEAEQVDESHYVLFALAPIRGSGLVVLPTHRLIRCAALSAETVAGASAPAMRWRREALEEEFWADPQSLLAPLGPGAVAMVDRGREALWLGELAEPAVMAELAPDQPQCWRELDVAILHRLVIDEHIAPHCSGEPEIAYSPRGADAAAALADGSADLALLMRPTPVEAVMAVSEARASMPHKSTYFFPKLTTGMVLKPLD
jgi:uncharacterized protein (DUF1015 family)